MPAQLDHLVVVAATLDQGVAWCERQLGVAPGPGGQHLRMGTHNRLLSLGDGIYLEVIAIDPEAGRPAVARWFGMDDPMLKKRVDVEPELRTFVVRCDDLAYAASALPRIGVPLPMQRAGLHWQIGVREDGVLQEGGALPTMIEWPPGVHPTATMPDLGCRLLRLEVRHPAPESLRKQWLALGLVESGQLLLQQADLPSLVAHIATPHGVRVLAG